MNRTYFRYFAFLLFLFGSAFPIGTQAAAPSFEISGWIPYWRVATGTQDVLPHLSQLKEVNPFGYSVKTDGTLFDLGKMTEEPWTSFFAKAKAAKVRVIPTVMWSDTESIDTVLRSPKLRAQHVKNIVAMVKEMGFDGVDIDYEGKKAETKPYYSAFLKELYAAMGDKFVMCTIEARTPVDSRYLSTPPKDATTYANDFVAVNKYCDRVRFMTYDQQFVDVRLAKAAGNSIYAPVADPAWIRKVITLAKKDIKASKIVIGVATYGYDYQVIPNSDGSGFSYNLIESFNPKYAVQTAAALGITPSRTSANEPYFAYVPAETPASLPSHARLTALAGEGTASAYRAAAGALALFKSSQQQAVFHVLEWSDAKAIADKVALAKELGVRGVAVFKFDGGADPALWSVLK